VFGERLVTGGVQNYSRRDRGGHAEIDANGKRYLADDRSSALAANAGIKSELTS
jgi:hypothetical protein